MSGTLEVKLPDQLEEFIEKRCDYTGQSKSELTRAAIIDHLDL